MKIGFLDRTQANWTAGASYTRSMVQALASAPAQDCEIHVLSGRYSSFSALPAGVREIRIDSESVSLSQIKKAVDDHRL
ncbi:MAG TPA: hypothetical protein VNB29_07510, partial [Chthoniobacterales bacterium]|nr:hypothetical protein [Chthoniobacterales bacterium]